MSGHDPRATGDTGWVAATLADAVADVEPHQDLPALRARVEEDIMTKRSRRRLGAAAAGLAVAATVAGVALAAGVGTDDDNADPGPVGTPSVDPSQSSGPTDDGSPMPPTSTGPLAVYYVGDTPVGPRLFREFRAPFGREDEGRLTAAVDMAVATPPYDPDYRTPWPEGTSATATLDGELVVDVEGSGDLRRRPAGMDGDEAAMAVQQLVHTAQAEVQQRVPVRFLVDGEETDRLLGEPVSQPVAAGDPMQVQAPVWVIDPQESSALTNPVTVSGRGAFFEANVSWQLFEDTPGQRPVEEGFATAQECCTLSPYRIELPELAPGNYVLRVYDADMSDGEGPGEHEDTKSFTVTE